MISAKLEHYTCMVDLLGHAGHLQEVENMVMAMPWKPHVAARMALLGACRIHGNVEMVECVARQILNMVMAMPWKPHVAARMALLGACRIHGNVEMGECVARQTLEMEPENAPDYGLASNIYAVAGNQHLCENVKG